MEDTAKSVGLSGHDLVCIRGERPVFARLDFQWDPGTACRLVGPNGAGKSSLLRLLAGLIAPAAGDIAWDGISIKEDREGHRARVSFVGHQDAIKPALSVRETLTFWSRLGGSPPSSNIVDTALEAFGLTALAETHGRILSSGQKRRAALARLLVESRPLWLLDEPTTGLDAASVSQLEAQIARHREQGGIAVVATHVPIDLPEAKTMDMSRYTAVRMVESAE